MPTAAKVLIGAALALVACTASSQPVGFPVEQPVALSARVALLEQKVHTLEQRTKAFQRVGLAPELGGAFQLVVNGARVRVSADGSISIAAPVPARAAEDPCDPPYSVDPKGLRSIKPECLKVGPCEPPFEVDPQGKRVPKPECL